MTAATEQRALPQNLEAEQAVLGAMLVNADIYWSLGDALAAEDFSEPLHQRMFRAIADMAGRACEVSPITLAAAIDGDAALAEMGGHRYLNNLAANAFSVISPRAYAELVKDTALRRALQIAAGHIHQLSLDNEADPRTLMERAQGKLDRVADSRREEEPIRSAAHYAREACLLTDEAQSSGRIPGVTFGLECLNDLTGGMKPGEFIVAAGRPGMGKSALASEIALAAATDGAGVLFFSFEMQGAPIATRMLASLAHRAGSPFAYEAALRGTLNPMERQAMTEAAKRLGPLPIDFRVKRGLTVSKLRIDCRRQIRQAEARGIPLKLIVIDYLQLLKAEATYKGNRVQEVSEITSDLKTLAGDLGLPILALSQLNREVEKRENKRPMLADLRESGSIEQDADVVLLLYRPEYYLEKERPDASDYDAMAAWTDEIVKVRNKFEIIVAKQRNGREGTAKAWCNMAYSAIRDAA